MVKKDNTTINSVDDLAGKNVATEANSTAVLALQQFAPQANVLLFQDDASCVAALQQGRADAYVLDESILLSDASTNPAFKLVGQPFTQGALRRRAAAGRPVGQAVRQRLAHQDLRRRQLGEALEGDRRQRRRG